MAQTIKRKRTAMRRTALSRPIALALADGFIDSESSVFDYGCGRGDDLKQLASLGVECSGWDPNHASDAAPRPAAVVNLGFVVNVIEDARERKETLEKAWVLAGRLLVVAARLTDEATGLAGKQLADGLLTNASTFQKFYSQEELRDWIDETLDVRSIAAAPGIFYVFRDSADVQRLLARRHSRSTPIPKIGLRTALYEQHATLLDELMEFMAMRGRLPRAGEWPLEPEVIAALGSLKRALRVVQSVTGDTAWEQAADRRAEDLLVYLALARFGKRPRFSELPIELQGDVKAHAGSYVAACELADAFLLRAGSQQTISSACARSDVGVLAEDALSVHVGALEELPPLLRVYEGCARVLTGAIEGAAIVRLRRDEARVEYLLFPRFERDPHPELTGIVSVALPRLSVRVRSLDGARDPLVLLGKDRYVAPSHSKRLLFARLTRQEERLGLLDEHALARPRSAWMRALSRAGVRVRGHRIEGSASGAAEESAPRLAMPAAAIREGSSSAADHERFE